jgi:septum formation protein
MWKSAAPITGERVVTSVVLASGSPRRAALLSGIGIAVEIVPSGYDEPADPSASPAVLAQRHARGKLDAVRPRFADRIVVAADTVVDVDGRALGKPADAAEATAMLRLLSGRAHLVHTAYAIGVPGAPAPLERLSTTSVVFHRLGDAEILAYVATGEPMDKAGAYGIQERASALVASVDGDYFTVVGFPLGAFIRDLRDLGFALPVAK